MLNQTQVFVTCYFLTLIGPGISLPTPSHRSNSALNLRSDSGSPNHSSNKLVNNHYSILGRNEIEARATTDDQDMDDVESQPYQQQQNSLKRLRPSQQQNGSPKRMKMSPPSANQDNPNMSLYQASYLGDITAVQSAVARGADVNAQVPYNKDEKDPSKDGLGGFPLQAAIMSGDEKVVEYLLGEGADPNVEGGLLGNSLYAASCSYKEYLVLLLLAMGAKVNAMGGRLRDATPLWIAELQGFDAIAAILRNHGGEAVGPRSLSD